VLENAHILMRIILFFKIIGASTANRFGCKTVLMLAVLLWSISTVVTPFLAQSVPLLIVCRVVLGLGEGLGKIERS